MKSQSPFVDVEGIALDIEFYRSRHADLAGFDDSRILDHFSKYGIREGRLPSTLSVRDGIIELCKQHESLLEIGPFNNPIVRGENVSYFDILDKEALVERAKAIGIDSHSIPEVQYSSPDGSLRGIDRKFDAVMSSHNIEHQVDLINHLREVSEILNDQGSYYLLIPDKRYCFDHYIQESSIADVISAHDEQRKVHSLGAVIEHRALTTHNDPGEHWAGRHGHHTLESYCHRIKAAEQEYEDAKGGYVDVHAWQFTPSGFSMIVNLLFLLGRSDFGDNLIFSTPYGGIEFTAILRKGPPKST